MTQMSEEKRERMTIAMGADRPTAVCYVMLTVIVL
jgi:hypothetical protein